jgi:hypothetical protein
VARTGRSRRFLPREHARDGIKIVHLRDPQLLVEQDQPASWPSSWRTVTAALPLSPNSGQ